VPPDSIEIEELSAFFQGWRAELIQISPSYGETRMSCALYPCHRTLWIQAGSALVLRGNVHRSSCCAWMSAKTKTPVRLLGQPMGRNELMLAGPAARIDLLVPAGAALSCLVVDSNEYFGRRTLRVCNADTRLARYLQTHDVRQDELDAGFDAEFLRASASARTVQLDRIARTQAISAVATACQIGDKRFPAAITLSELERRCRVSQRTLEYGFQQVYGTTPMAFIRSQRLTRNRTELLRAAARTSISETARRCGFTHMGQYSRDYRRLFGETPSLTLARTQR
jgi:AraC-like DNA-binding protein